MCEVCNELREWLEEERERYEYLWDIGEIDTDMALNRSDQYGAVLLKLAKLEKEKCPKCHGTGWLHGCQGWSESRLSKGTPYYSEKCDCSAGEKT